MKRVQGAGTQHEGHERHGTWYSYDVPYQRMQLFSPWTIAGFGLTVGIGLLLVYPQQTLEERLGFSYLSGKPDRLTIEYLKVFLKAEPNAKGLRSALVDQLVSLGSYDEAREVLILMRNSSEPAVRLDANWLELKMREQEAFAASSGSLSRERLLLRARQQLTLLLAIPQDSAHLLTIGRKALALGDVVVAAKAFEQLAARPELLDSDIYAEAARAALGLGNYVTASELYFRAMRAATVLEQRRSYFFIGLQTLQAGGLYDAVIDAADRHLGTLANDTPTLLFLARLAQAANKLDAAERYAKRLLQLSLLRYYPGTRPVLMVSRETPADFYAGLNRATTYSPTHQRIANEVGTVAASKPPGLKFDEEAYALSYDIFLANRNLNDARRVAESAVRQRPDDSAWRKRLAQVNEWNANPAAALPHWLAYARLTSDETVWDIVMGLAIGLEDQQTQLQVVEHKVAIDPDNPKWLDRLVQIHENAGHPEIALDLLRRAVAPLGSHGMHRQHQLELLASLTARLGNDAENLATLRLLQKEFGPSTRYALQIADQLYRSGQPSVAFSEMERAAATAATNDTAFWRAYAELARLLQDDATAKKGYRTILASDRQNEDDLTNLIALIEPTQPLAAARLAEFAFARFGNVQTALIAISLRTRIADWRGAKALLSSLTLQQRLLLEKNASFLAVRSSIAQADNDVQTATRDMRAALALRPDDMEIRAGLLWLLIAARDNTSLKATLSAWAHDAESNRILWDPFAAALMSTNRKAEALHWFRKSGFQRDDYLWLMSYAEALDATSQHDLAWRIRRRVWLDLRKPEVLRKAPLAQWINLRDRLLSVTPLFMSGDGASRVMQALLRADVSQLKEYVAPPQIPRSGSDMLALLDRTETQLLPAALMSRRLDKAQASSQPLEALLMPGDGNRPHDDARLTASVRELALAYALNNNASDLAGAWFATRFADQLTKPLYGELALALQADDRTGLNKLLDDLPDWLPMYDRIEAAQRAGRPALAQTLAFDQFALLPHDDELHLRLTTLTTEQPPNFSMDVTYKKQSPLAAREAHIDTSINLAPGLKLTVGLIDRQYRSIDGKALINLPASDREIGLTLRKQMGAGFVDIAVNQRQASASTTGLRMDYQLALVPALSLSGSAEFRQPATESALLRVAAVRSGMSSTLDYAISRADYARFGVGTYRYGSQTGSALGTGFTWNIEAGTHVRIDYPNLTLRAFAAGSTYHDAGHIGASIAKLLPAQIDATRYRVLPQNDTVIGLGLGVGTVIENRYSRAWRPFAEIGTTYSRVIGSGYNLRAGVAGSVLGQDLMTLRGLRGSGTAANPQGTQEFGVEYKWFY